MILGNGVVLISNLGVVTAQSVVHYNINEV